jgi:aminoglycoside phosphotransferase (APT) family kinase protein
MDGQGLGSGPLTDVRRLAGGTQNIMLSFQRGGRGYVLRRPPPHPTADGSGTMRKEIRVLTSLAATDVPHPRLTSASPTYADTQLWASGRGTATAAP